MQQLFFADIFFLVTTISVVLVAATAAALLMYVALIARDLRKISKKLKKESIACIDDMIVIKDYIFSEKERFIDVVLFIVNVIKELRGSSIKKKSSSKKTKSRKRKSKSTKVSVKKG